mmetsp:Transcript_61362/g.121457  ORF Transcript_61362/g.121457 Transcript_61362/m.121457 type:complete len:87 (-) Transcript_61362:117-377(-)
MDTVATVAASAGRTPARVESSRRVNGWDGAWPMETASKVSKEEDIPKTCFVCMRMNRAAQTVGYVVPLCDTANPTVWGPTQKELRP